LKGHKIAKVQKEPRITPKVVSAVFSKVKKGENTVILQAFFCGINKVNFFTFPLSHLQK
jgi:hypothetical protein